MWRWQLANVEPPDPADPARSGWEQRAVLAHSVYAPEVRHPVEVAVAGKTPDEARAQEEHLSRWLTKRLNMPVKLFDLRAQGYELIGGRLLPDTSAPSAQLMYQRIGDPMAPRVTVYLRKPDSTTPAAFRYDRQEDLGMFYWVDGATGYALCGALPKEQLLALSEAIYRQGRS
jgi:anti-sigma factor RsiW